MVLPALAIILLAAAVFALVLFGMTDWWEIAFICVTVGFVYYSISPK